VIEDNLISLTAKISELIERNLHIYQVYDYKKHFKNFDKIMGDILKFKERKVILIPEGDKDLLFQC